MTFITREKTGFELGNFIVSDTGTVFISAPTTNLNPATKLYVDTAVAAAVSQLSTVTTTLTGDITGSGITSIPTSLTSTGVTPGTYTRLSVDSKGRITTGTDIVFTQGTVQGVMSGSQVTLNLQSNGMISGTYNTVTVDNTGRITTATNLSSTNIVSILGYTPLNRAGDTLTGLLSTTIAPTVKQHLVNKQYADRQFYISLALGG